MRVSAKTGEGVDAFRAWLQALPARAGAAASDHVHAHDEHDHVHAHDEHDHDHEHAPA